MSSPYTVQYYATAEPMSVPAGKVDYSAYYGSDGTYSVSPPEYAGSETSESGNGSYSYSNANYSTTTSSYAGSSQGDYDTAGSASGVDLNDYMQDRFTSAFDPVELDKGIAAQAQTSGRLNDKRQKVLELQQKTQARLAKSRARLAQGMADAKKVHEDLEYTTKQMSALKVKASKKHGKEYSRARQRHPSPDN